MALGGGVARSGGRDFAARGDSPLLPGWLVDVWHLEIIDSGSLATGSCGIVNTRRKDERETELLHCPEAPPPHAQECSCQPYARASPGERSAGACELETTRCCVGEARTIRIYNFSAAIIKNYC